MTTTKIYLAMKQCQIMKIITMTKKSVSSGTHFSAMLNDTFNYAYFPIKMLWVPSSTGRIFVRDAFAFTAWCNYSFVV